MCKQFDSWQSQQSKISISSSIISRKQLNKQLDFLWPMISDSLLRYVDVTGRALAPPWRLNQLADPFSAVLHQCNHCIQMWHRVQRTTNLYRCRLFTWYLDRPQSCTWKKIFIIIMNTWWCVQTITNNSCGRPNTYKP